MASRGGDDRKGRIANLDLLTHELIVQSGGGMIQVRVAD